MAFDYAALRDGAVKRLLDNFGQDVTVSVWSEGTYNAETGTATPSYSDKTVRGVALEIRDEQINGTKVQAGDKLALLRGVDTSGNTYSVDTHAKVTIGGESHEVVRNLPTDPAGTAVIYKLMIRGT